MDTLEPEVSRAVLIVVSLANDLEAGKTASGGQQKHASREDE